MWYPRRLQSKSMIEFASSSDWELQLEDGKEIPGWLKLSRTSGVLIIHDNFTYLFISFGPGSTEKTNR